MQRRSWTALRRLRTLSSGPSDLDVAVGLQVGQEPLGFPLKLAEVHLGHVASVLEQLLWTRFVVHGSTVTFPIDAAIDRKWIAQQTVCLAR